MNDNVRGASAMAEWPASPGRRLRTSRIWTRSRRFCGGAIRPHRAGALLHDPAAGAHEGTSTWRMGSRFPLAVDGTALQLRRTALRELHRDTPRLRRRHLQHKLLVAYIVSDEGYALPVACEFIENPARSM